MFNTDSTDRFSTHMCTHTHTSTPFCTRESVHDRYADSKGHPLGNADLIQLPPTRGPGFRGEMGRAKRSRQQRRRATHLTQHQASLPCVLSALQHPLCVRPQRWGRDSKLELSLCLGWMQNRGNPYCPVRGEGYHDMAFACRTWKVSCRRWPWNPALKDE